MVLVTQNQYILAHKIHHITLDEVVNHDEVRSRVGKVISKKDISYIIHVVYSPEEVSTQNSGMMKNNYEQRECTVTIRNVVNAHKVFRDLIQQIREQMPDQLYLDTALERMIATNSVVSVDDKGQYEDLNEDEDDDWGHLPTYREKRKYDGGSKKVRKSGKTKRRSKKVLRKSKRSNSSSSKRSRS